MATRTKPSSVKTEPRAGSSSLASRVKIDPSFKDKKKIPIMSDTKPRSAVSTVMVKSEAKPRISVNSTKSIASTSAASKGKREKKVFSLAGQKYDPPEEREPLRIFYESLWKQIPGSEMAEFWLMEHGMLSPDKAKRAHEKKLRKMKQIRMGVPIKPTPSYSSKAVTVSSQRPSTTSKNIGLDARNKKRVVDDDDVILSPKRRKV